MKSKTSKNAFMLFIFLQLVGCGSVEHHNLFITNGDKTTIDSLHIFIGDQKYLIEDLSPNQTKSIKLNQSGEYIIYLQADQEAPISNGLTILPRPKGRLNIYMSKTNILSSSS